MKVAVGQLNPTIGDLRGNFKKIESMTMQARNDGARLIIFPELAITGYPPRDLLLYDAFLESVEKIITEEVLPLSRGIAILIGAPWKEESCGGFSLFNSAILLDDGALLSRHGKTLLPNYDVFDERRYFSPALQRVPAVLDGKRIAVTICEDIWNDKDYWERQRYREDPVEELFQQGAELLINISASPYHDQKAGQRAKMLCALSKKYESGVIYVNQVGGNDELIFDGSSMVCSAEGSMVYQARPFEESLFYLDTEDLGKFHDHHCQVVTESTLSSKGKDVDHESFFSGVLQEEGITWVYAALCLGLKDYLEKTGFKEVVIGLSGGIDSAVTAAIAAAALGPEKVLGVLMPSRYSSSHSVEDAEQLAHNLMIDFIAIPIEETFQTYLRLLNKNNEPKLDLAEENIQARIRGNLLMFISNRDGRMVLTTGNKSELAVGYCTLYGDMSGGLAVLADLPKTMVYQLACFINKKAKKEVIPVSVINKPPSAELRPDQKDQDSLPPYEVLDEILHYYIEENKHLHEIEAFGFDRNLVEEIITKVDRAEYKRFQAAPGLRVTTKAFGSDRRMPLARGVFHNTETYSKKLDRTK